MAPTLLRTGISVVLLVAGSAIAIRAAIVMSANSTATATCDDAVGTTMKAISYSQHGPADDVLRMTADYPRPVPGKNDVLIQIKASSVNPVDFKLRRNSVPNFLVPKPKIPGEDVAGVVVELGANVSKRSKFRIGDRVAAMLPVIRSKWGSSAEFVAVDASLVAKIPETVELESAAALPLVSLTVVQSLKKVKEPKGKKILIHAGAGGVGTFAIQYAKNVLGMHVATTASKEKTEIVKALGADLVIDYKSQDFTEVVKDYDAILDPMSFLYEGRTLKSNVLKKTGHYLSIMSSDWALREDGKEKSYGARTYWNIFKHKLANLITPGWFVPKYDICMVNPNGDDLQLVMDLLEEKKVNAVIDSKFSLADMAKAHRHLEGGHVTGKVVIQH